MAPPHRWRSSERGGLLVASRSRGAQGINQGFLDWLAGQRRRDRPFFTFLNYFDAHEPFVLPRGYESRLGLPGESPRDDTALVDYWYADKLKLAAKDVSLVKDPYDDCIAYLDREVGSLLDELERRGSLQDTWVIVTSDHGEEFGEHGVYNHGYSLFLPEVHVPLVVIPPTSIAESGVVGLYGSQKFYALRST